MKRINLLKILKAKIPYFLTGLLVVLWDERGTTVTAARYLNATDTRGKKRKAVIDAVAAVVILESYLGWRKNHPED